MFRFIFLLLCIGAYTSLSLFIFFPVYAQTKISLNEFVVHPSADKPEWVELSIVADMDCTGYWIDDDIDFAVDTGNGKKIQLESCHPEKEDAYKIVEISSAFFNNVADTVALFNAEGMLVDSYTYTSDPGVDISIGRFPDREGAWSVLEKVTKGQANSGPLPTQTPTPTITPKPTKEPTSRPDPTEKGEAPTIGDISYTPLSPLLYPTLVISIRITPVHMASNGAYPTAILPSDITMRPTRFPTPTTKLMVKGASRSAPIFTMVGGFFLISCAILMILRR